MPRRRARRPPGARRGSSRASLAGSTGFSRRPDRQREREERRAKERLADEPADRRARPTGRGARWSTTCRPMSTSRPYWTPEGHVVSQLRHVRQRSRWRRVFAVTLASLEHLLDEIDAPARAVLLVAQQEVRRARRRAEAAVHARAQDRVGFAPLGRVADEIGERGLHQRVRNRDTGGRGSGCPRDRTPP